MKVFQISIVIFILGAFTLNYFYSDRPMKKQTEIHNHAADWVPQWAKEVVWYQIFPERFRNGDPKNDPKLSDIKGSWPNDNTSPWELHPWTSDWYELQPYEKKNGKDIWFNLQRRRYGGDLQGIIDKLDYLKELGVGAIYLNPVFEAPSLHKYDGATYHHIDPTFGPDPDGDRKLIATETPDNPNTWVWTSADKLALKLIEEVHHRGMKIIFDGVFNHMGVNSFAFQDVVRNQQNSKYKDWFTIKSYDDPKKGTKFDYEGWFGVRELPELREDSTGLVKGPKEYIFASTKRWMSPDGKTSAGIDGWRLDVAFCVSHKFWKDWRTLVKSINHEAYLTAEVIDPISVIKPYVSGDEFDAVMNYNFAFASSEFFIDQKNRISVTTFDTTLRDLRDSFGLGVAYVQQNLFGSHDANRIGSHIANPDLEKYRNWGAFYGASKGDNPKYKIRKPTDEELKIQYLFVIFQMTYLGAPMVYYGDEVGMWGANDPDCRKPMVWDDLTYSDETFNPDQTKRNPDKVAVDKNLLVHYQKLIRIRNENPAIQLGDFKTVLIDDRNQLYGFSRNYLNQSVVVVLNNDSQNHSTEIKNLTNGVYLDVLNHDQKYLISGSSVKLDLTGKWGVILKKF